MLVLKCIDVVCYTSIEVDDEAEESLVHVRYCSLFDVQGLDLLPKGFLSIYQAINTFRKQYMMCWPPESFALGAKRVMTISI